MINATTSLIPILTVQSTNSEYYNISITLFSIIATLNHLFPENLDGTTHLVKLLVTNILFSLLDINPALGITISLLDLSPLLFANKLLVSIGELLIQVPRQIIDAYLVYLIYSKGFIIRALFIIICKIVYFFERRLRIKRGERNNFYFFHCFEHLGLHTLLCTMVDAPLFNFWAFLAMFLCFMASWSFILFLITFYFSKTFLSRAPAYIKSNKEMMDMLEAKIQKNLLKGKIHNYICKPWTTHLKMEIVTWNRIEKCCKELSIKLVPQEIDYVVGIATGGVYVAACIGKLIDRPVKIINSRLWSGITFYENYEKVHKFFTGKGDLVKPEITGIPEIEGKRILLCDDTTYTGLTMMNCINWATNVCKAKEVKTLIIWIHQRFIPDYYLSQKRVPIVWEWGSEMD